MSKGLWIYKRIIIAFVFIMVGMQIESHGTRYFSDPSYFPRATDIVLFVCYLALGIILISEAPLVKEEPKDNKLFEFENEKK